MVRSHLSDHLTKKIAGDRIQLVDALVKSSL
ncbi:Protein of unknown function [Lactobacillus gigeriorum DSM 23908 = CRBIP 24.85]|uniref:Uncharacterized protein n=1 Tax=Lactobacillus gigeriorum DSM 23908 = CRBIP 24.85 TaxID=1423751 RepID=I7J1G7_9LACO|nr:Protein of unknown function [Lactobacillus gigeriorum DSM 23908 = CRBIP 24.85]